MFSTYYRGRQGRSQCELSLTIVWEPLTKDSSTDNLRPIIVSSDDRRAVLWLRGEYRSFTDYQLDVVGIVEPID